MCPCQDSSAAVNDPTPRDPASDSSGNGSGNGSSDRDNGDRQPPRW